MTTVTQQRYDFERFEKEIQSALKYSGGYTLEDIWEEIEEGDLQMWPGDNSVIITTLLQQKHGLTLHFFLAAGTQEELKRTYPIVMAWGIDKGCVMATFTGRKGWERSFLVREDGWTPTLVTYQKEL